MNDASSPTDPTAQAKYEVRFDWGSEGAVSIAPGAGVIVVVDALSFTTITAGPDSESESQSSGVVSSDGSRLSAELARYGVPVLAASLRNRTAVAQWILRHQTELGSRAMVAVVAAGETRPTGSTRFAVEDLLVAGSVVDALADLGIDYCSPEAATASAAYAGLKRATAHLFTASASGQELIEAGYRDDVELAGKLDVSTVVPVLGEFGFGA